MSLVRMWHEEYGSDSPNTGRIMWEALLEGDRYGSGVEYAIVPGGYDKALDAVAFQMSETIHKVLTGKTRSQEALELAMATHKHIVAMESDRV